MNKRDIEILKEEINKKYDKKLKECAEEHNRRGIFQSGIHENAKVSKPSGAHAQII